MKNPGVSDCLLHSFMIAFLDGMGDKPRPSGVMFKCSIVPVFSDRSFRELLPQGGEGPTETTMKSG